MRVLLGEQRTLNRAAVLFRVVLLIPVFIVSGLLFNGVWLLGFVTWVAELALGRIPATLFEANAAALRYGVRFQAYLTMLTSAYPKKLFGDGSVIGARPTTSPLLLSGAARAWIVVSLVLGLMTNIANDSKSTPNLSHEDNQPQSAHRY